MKKSQPLAHLNGLSPAEFLRVYWQKKPLLIRNAFPDFNAPLTVDEIFELAAREEAESRLIVNLNGNWDLHHGPVSKKLLAAAQKSLWTILIQDTQHFSYEAHELLAQFSFIPTARIDDLMVSYANKGGGVGPHFDSYDVFLLQGEGERRWQISSQHDLSLSPGHPLKIMANFRAEQEWILKTGDMLYLPPGCAHNGVAETNCVTWSIGFRAPAAEELSHAYLDFLRDEVSPHGLYKDADLKPTVTPGGIDLDMQSRLIKILSCVTHASGHIDTMKRFAGRYFTEPKSHVYFDAPDVIMSAEMAAQNIRERGVQLDLKTRLLFVDTLFFINGEDLDVPSKDRAVWRVLANNRILSCEEVAELSENSFALLQNLLNNGYLHIH
jgi:50S ribosomal protein L16 3-hydroxylase